VLIRCTEGETTKFAARVSLVFSFQAYPSPVPWRKASTGANKYKRDIGSTREASVRESRGSIGRRWNGAVRRSGGSSRADQVPVVSLFARFFMPSTSSVVFNILPAQRQVGRCEWLGTNARYQRPA